MSDPTPKTPSAGEVRAQLGDWLGLRFGEASHYIVLVVDEDQDVRLFMNCCDFSDEEKALMREMLAMGSQAVEDPGKFMSQEQLFATMALEAREPDPEPGSDG